MSDGFHQTRMGQVFYTSTMPGIAHQLKRIADALVTLTRVLQDAERARAERKDGAP